MLTPLIAGPIPLAGFEQGTAAGPVLSGTGGGQLLAVSVADSRQTADPVLLLTKHWSAGALRFEGQKVN